MSDTKWYVRKADGPGVDTTWWIVVTTPAYKEGVEKQYITRTGGLVKGQRQRRSDVGFDSEAEAQAALDKYLGKQPMTATEICNHALGMLDRKVPYDKLVVGRKYRIERADGAPGCDPYGSPRSVTLTEIVCNGAWFMCDHPNCVSGNPLTSYKFYEVAQDPTPEAAQASPEQYGKGPGVAALHEWHRIKDAAAMFIPRKYSKLKQEPKQKQEITIMFKKALHRIVVVWCLYGLVRVGLFVQPYVTWLGGRMGLSNEKHGALCEELIPWLAIIVGGVVLLSVCMGIHAFSNWFFNTPKK